jgi:hypothetical protein
MWLQFYLMLAACVGVGFSLASYAEENPWLRDDQFKLAVGVFIKDYDSDFRLTSGAFNISTDLSFEDDLGLDESNTVYRFDGHYRFAARHRIELSYFDLTRDGKVTTRFPIIVDDTLFPRGSLLRTELKFEVYKLAYAYSVWQTEAIDISLSGGLYSFDLGLNMRADGGQREDSGSFSAFPMFGLHGEYRMLKRLFFAASFEYFAINEDDFEGELTDAMISLEYRLFDHVGLGAGYNRVTVYAEDSNSDDKFDYQYDGILAYLTVSF